MAVTVEVELAAGSATISDENCQRSAEQLSE